MEYVRNKGNYAVKLKTNDTVSVKNLTSMRKYRASLTRKEFEEMEASLRYFGFRIHDEKTRLIITMSDKSTFEMKEHKNDDMHFIRRLTRARIDNEDKWSFRFMVCLWVIICLMIVNMFK